MQIDKTNCLTVSELTKRIKNNIESGFPDIFLIGEISNYKPSSSGHWYFSLKDNNAVIRAIIFSFSQKSIKFDLEDGLEIICHGRLNVYEKGGSYSLIIDYAEPVKIGSLQLAFEQLKNKLQKQGLFDKEHKKLIPKYPQQIAIVTSPTGAALRDILRIMKRRFSQANIIIIPCSVQGENARDEITRGIKLANLYNLAEVLIVGRGGGSLEDLWPFNEEKVARAIFNSSIPVISAVGHQIDFTISDFVADFRAATPSEAAEIVVRNKEEILLQMAHYTSKLFQNTNQVLERKKLLFNSFKQQELKKKMINYYQEKILIFENLKDQLLLYSTQYLHNIKQKFSLLINKLNSLSPLNTLSRGYSFVTIKKTGEILSDSKLVKINDRIIIQLHRGSLESNVEKIEINNNERKLETK